MKNNKSVNKKILKKFLSLLDKDYKMDECLEQFPDHRDELIGYYEMIGRLKDLQALNVKEDYLKQNLKDIYAKARIENLKDQNHITKKDLFLIRLRPAFLKPLSIFLSVFVFFSFSFAGTVYASTDTVPGETLYTVKRASESIQIAFTPYDSEGNLYFKFLTRRLNEADVLLQKSDDISLSFAGDLLTDIDFSYGKCLEHKYRGLNDGGKMKGRINKLKEDFNEKCRMQGMGNEKQNMGQNGNGQNTDEQCGSMGSQLQNNTTNKEQQNNSDSSNPSSDSPKETIFMDSQTHNQCNYDLGNNKYYDDQSNNTDYGTGKGQAIEGASEDEKSKETVNAGDYNTATQSNSQGDSLK
jgi:hypothetical protein